MDGPKCPKCNSQRFYLFQSVIEKCSLASIDFDAEEFELDAVEDTYENDSFETFLECENCNKKFNLRGFER